VFWKKGGFKHSYSGLAMSGEFINIYYRRRVLSRKKLLILSGIGHFSKK
jgi:hypothetical protein